MIRKVLTFEIKEVRDRVLEFVGSTEDVDRVGDVIMANGWQLKHYKKNPVFLWAHQYDTPPVGKAVKVWLDNDRLKFHIQFATPEEYEFADTIYKLYKGGYLRATSVGFMPLDSEPMEKEDEGTFMRPTRFLKQDLLELSACPVPANPNALAEARAKGLVGQETVNEIIETVVYEDAAQGNATTCSGLSEGDDTITDTYEEKPDEALQRPGIPPKHGQEAVADELDYCLTLINEEGLNEENTELAWRLVDEIVRLSGGDIPVGIAGKIREVTAPPAAELTQDDIRHLITETVGQVIAQARGINYGGRK